MATRTVSRSFKAILALLLVMVVMAAAIVASAAVPARALATDKYGVWIAGTEVTSDNADDIFGDGTASYEGTGVGGTLTLNDFVSTGQGCKGSLCNALIYSEMPDLTINLIGNNTLQPDGTTYPYGIYAEWNLTFTGSGNLAVSADGGTESFGIYAGPIGGTDGGTIVLDESFTGTISAQAGESIDGRSCGVFAYEKLEVNGGTLVATGARSDASSSSGNDKASSGVGAANVYVNGGVVIAQGGTSGTRTIGVNSVGLHVSGGALIARAGDFEAGGSYDPSSGFPRYAYWGVLTLKDAQVVASVAASLLGLEEDVDPDQATGIVILPTSYKSLDDASAFNAGVLSSNAYKITTNGDTYAYADEILDTKGYTVLFLDMRELPDDQSFCAGVAFMDADCTITGTGKVVAVGGMIGIDSIYASVGIASAKAITVDGPTIVAVGGPVAHEGAYDAETAGFALDSESSESEDALTIKSGNVVGIGGSIYGDDLSEGSSDGIVSTCTFIIEDSASVMGVGGWAEGGYSIGIATGDSGLRASGSADVLGVAGYSKLSTSIGLTGILVAQDKARLAGVGGVAGSVGGDGGISVGVLCGATVEQGATLIGLGGMAAGGDIYSIGLFIQYSADETTIAYDGSLVAAGRTQALLYSSEGEPVFKISDDARAECYADYEGAGTAEIWTGSKAVSDLESYQRIVVKSPYVATWKVRFDANGGSGTMKPVTVSDGDSYTLPACGFTAPEGKEFDKWDKGAVGATIKVTADVTVKAQWKSKASPSPDPVGPASWKRLSGDNALDTMAAIIDEGGFPTGGTVVLASLEGYWDALTAAGIAGLEDAPVVMALQDSLSAQSTAQLKKLKPTKIIVCGGTYWIPDSVVAEAAAAAGIPTSAVTRLAGDNAAITAAKIAAAGKGKWCDTAIVATAGTFQDALAAAPLSYAKSMPIFLAQYDFAAEKGYITADTIKAMQDAGIKQCYIAGGTYWLPKQITTDLEKAGIKVLAQLGGDTAVETSAAIAKVAISQYGMKADGMGVADVRYWYDALAGAAFCGRNDSVLLLALNEKSSSIEAAGGYASDMGKAYILGGKSSVSPETEAALKAVTA